MRKATEILNSLKNILEFHNDSIKEVSDEIIKEGISFYPVFIAHENEIPLGELILDRNYYQTDWHISVTTLEDLIEKNIILKEKVEDFKKIYKPPSDYICVLLLSEKGANFIFHPFRK